MNNASMIKVTNKGGYVFNFSVQWLDPSDGTWHTTQWNSGNYPVLQSVTTPELGSIGVPEDALAVTPYGHAIAGTSGQGHAFVRYAKNSSTAEYEARGTTFIGFEVVLI